MHDLLLDRQDHLTAPDLMRYAEELGLDTERSHHDLKPALVRGTGRPGPRLGRPVRRLRHPPMFFAQMGPPPRCLRPASLRQAVSLRPCPRRGWPGLGGRRPVADGGSGDSDPSQMGGRGNDSPVLFWRRPRDGSPVLASPSATAHRSWRRHLRCPGGPGVAICDGSPVTGIAIYDGSADSTRVGGGGVRGTTIRCCSDEPATKTGTPSSSGTPTAEVPLSTLDVHQLDQILLVGTGVLPLGDPGGAALGRRGACRACSSTC